MVTFRKYVLAQPQDFALPGTKYEVRFFVADISADPELTWQSSRRQMLKRVEQEPAYDLIKYLWDGYKASLRHSQSHTPVLPRPTGSLSA